MLRVPQAAPSALPMPSADEINAKHRAALASVLASGGLTLAKLIVGLLTGSIGILSEAAHNLLDLGATLITFFAVRVSDKPPDEKHPYGHGKVESVAALVETGLLFLTAAVIVREAGRRLLSGESEVEVTWWSAAVILGSMIVDTARARGLAKVARATRSAALEADALHFLTDIVSSGVVLVGLGLVGLGLKLADSLAAIGVAAAICLAGARLFSRTFDTLVDAAPPGMTRQVRSIAERTPGVVEVHRARVRSAGSWLQVDLEALVSRRLSPDRTAELRQQVAERVRAALPEAEVTVSTVPIPLDDETMRERILMIAAYHGLAIHHVTVQHLGERLAISLDLEVGAALMLREAHVIASQLEEAIKAQLGGEVEVDTHIEPLMADDLSSVDAPPELTRAVADSIALIAQELDQVLDTHDVRVRQGKAGLFISFHCAFAPDGRVDQVHDAVSIIETRLRQRWNAHRIVTHAEPPEAA